MSSVANEDEEEVVGDEEDLVSHQSVRFRSLGQTCGSDLQCGTKQEEECLCER